MARDFRLNKSTMSNGRTFLLVGSALLSLVTAFQPLAATENHSKSDPAESAHAIDDIYRLTHSPPRLDAWDPCVSQGDLSEAQRLCFTAEHSTSEMQDLQLKIYYQLSAGDADEERLCKIDNSLVEVLNTCPSLNTDNIWRGVAGGPIASLFDVLAGNWARQGTFVRADRLYYQAYAMLLQERSLDGIRIVVIQHWANLMMDWGRRDAAIRLVNLQVETARERYLCRTGFLSQLIDTLDFKSRILHRLGDLLGSQAALDEISRLSKMPDSCHGMLCPGRAQAGECR